MYLDHAATTPIRPEARDALIKALDEFGGNASGTHAVARAAKNALEEARERAGEILGASRPDEIVFTSGGTESDNLGVVGTVLASERPTIVTSGIEHKAVVESAAFLEASGRSWITVGCDREGAIRPDAVATVVDTETATVSIMAANNEVGTMTPIADVAAAARASDDGVLVHTDAVQAFVGTDVTTKSTGADLISLSAHKFGGPKGVGLLYARSGVALKPTSHGGGQEAGRRSGTSNVPGIVSMVAAMEAAAADRERFAQVVGGERDRFEAVLGERLPGVVVTAAAADRLPQFSHIRLSGRHAETALIRMDQAGVYAAAGSACQSGAVEPSHVLTAMGFEASEVAECVRFTFGWPTRPGDGEAAAHAVADALGSPA